jgi:hypothetical protein
VPAAPRAVAEPVGPDHRAGVDGDPVAEDAVVVQYGVRVEDDAAASRQPQPTTAPAWSREPAPTSEPSPTTAYGPIATSRPSRAVAATWAVGCTPLALGESWTRG